MRYGFLLVVALYGSFFRCASGGEKEVVILEVNDPRVQFAADRVAEAVGDTGAVTIVFALDTLGGDLSPEGFRLRVAADQIEVAGGGAAGAMYGGLELAEQIRLRGIDGVQPLTRNPYLERRGVKFNIPLDARTPSYTDASDAGQQNIDDVWDFTFWQRYLDALATHRYNYVSLWSLHPFPSLVRVPGYEDVALDDVHRSAAAWDEYYHLHGTGLDAPGLLENPEIVRKMSVDEKIKFWRRVMAYAKTRNIDFYLITWNIFTNGTEGKYGITDAIDNPVTIDYFRKSVTACFRTYPDLAGIGLTTGENMHRQSFDAKEDWAYATYAAGMLDAAGEFPDRRFTFIHRQHQTGAKDIAEKFRELIEHPNVDFLFSFKYAKAHVMSATEQPYHPGFVRDIAGLKTIWGLRNDSNYHLRWGAPDFVREFIGHLPTEVAAGIYYGADQWVQGRDFLTKDPQLAGQLEIDKNWYQWLLWGRLAFDPTLDNDRLTALLGERFPTMKATTLFAAWQEASLVLPAVTGFHWGVLDFKWYPEACKSRPAQARNATGFHDVNRFISVGTHPKAGFQSIRDFLRDGRREPLLTPGEVARKIAGHAARADELLAELGSTTDPELSATLQDIRALSRLGHYYAAKINGALEVARYRHTGAAPARRQAIDFLTEARKFWAQYVALLDEQYHNPLWTNRVGYIDWEQISAQVATDIDIARQAEYGADPTLNH